MERLEEAARRDTESFADWPDLMFTEYCFRSYRVNRGIYNTAEMWLYRRGYADIRARREMLLRFFAFAGSRYGSDGTNKFIRFGAGGLTACLESFLSRGRFYRQ